MGKGESRGAEKLGISILVSIKLKNNNNENIAELSARIILFFLAHINKFFNRLNWLV